MHAVQHFNPRQAVQHCYLIPSFYNAASPWFSSRAEAAAAAAADATAAASAAAAAAE